MDIWESNKYAQAVTPHPCAPLVTKQGQTRCNGTACGDGDDRYNGLCDKDGGDLNPFRKCTLLAMAVRVMSRAHQAVALPLTRLW